MSDTDTILKAISDLTQKFDRQDAKIDNLQKGQDTLTRKVDNLNSEVSHIKTAIKHLPARGEVEEIVDTAKKEIKADILNLDAKFSRELQGHKRRLTNLEEQAGIEDPNKN